MGGDDENGTDEAFRIGAWLVRPGELTLSQGGKSVPLEAKVMDVLVELARAQGRVVTREALIEAVWGTEYGGDESLTRAISLIRRALGDSRGEHNHIRTVPKRGYQLIADVEPSTDTRESSAANSPGISERPKQDPPDSAHGPGPKRFSWRWLIPALVGLAVVLAIGVGLNRSSTSSGTGDAMPQVQTSTIEIRAFESPPGDLRARRFEQILSGSLAAVSIRSFQKTPTSSRSGEFAVNGIVDVEAETGTLTLQVDHSPSGLTLYADTFSAPLPEFDRSAQARLASLGSLLQCLLTFRDSADPETLLLYLNLCESLDDYDQPANLERSRQLLTAIPDSSSAKSLRAFVLSMSTILIPGQAVDTRSIDEAWALAEEQITTDPQDALAHMALAILLRNQGDLIGAGAHFEFAAEADPHLYMVSSFMGEFYRQTGQIHDAIQMAGRARASHPYQCWPVFQEGWLTAAFVDLDQGFQMLNAARELCPNDSGYDESYNQSLLLMYGTTPQVESALENWGDQFSRRRNLKSCYRSFAQERLSESPDAHRTDSVCESAGLQIDYRIRFAAILEDLDLSFDLHATADGLTVHFFYPEMAGFRADPRFMPLAASRGLTEYWLESGHWPDFCSEQRDLPYDCREEALRATQDRE